MGEDLKDTMAFADLRADIGHDGIFVYFIGEVKGAKRFKMGRAPSTLAELQRLEYVGGQENN